MNSLLFKTFLITATLRSGYAFSFTNLHNFVEVFLRTPKQYTSLSDNDSGEQIPNNTMSMFVSDDESEIETDYNIHDKDTKRINPYRNVSHAKEKSVLRSDVPNIVAVRGQRNHSFDATTRRSLMHTIRTTVTVPMIGGLSKMKQLAHERRRREIIEHMSHHFQSTLYFYNEVRRIEKSHEVMDELRIMALELEHPNNRHWRELVFKCYWVKHKTEVKDIWDHKTNNLIINPNRDPDNEGVYNKK